MTPEPAAGNGVEIWPFEGHPGFVRAIESAGSVAAPLLAGFAFTLLVLVMPSLEPASTEIVTRSGVAVVHKSEAFSASPALAAACLLFAGISLVFSVQAAIGLRYHNHSPSELAEWYPEYFPHTTEDPPPAAEILGEWSSEDWPAMRVGGEWYGGWPRRYLAEERRKAHRYATWMRRLYHAGILSLLLGLTVLVWPPVTSAGPGRWSLVMIGALGVAIEIGWIAWPMLTRTAGTDPKSNRRSLP